MKLLSDILFGIAVGLGIFFLIGIIYAEFKGYIPMPNDPNIGSIKWEAMRDSSGLMPTSYRARIYGGWLVSVEGDLVFISLNSPNGWVLDYEEKK